jgi:hypothetical protein
MGSKYAFKFSIPTAPQKASLKEYEKERHNKKPW